MKTCIASLILVSNLVWAAAVAESSEIVLVKNADVEVTDLDFEAELQRIPERDRGEFRASLDRISKLLGSLFINRSLAQEATSAGLDQDPVFQRRVQLYAEAQLARMRIDSYLAESELPDFSGRAREIYLTETDRFASKAQVRASHILIDDKERSPEEALQLSRDVRSRALAGEAFDSLAREYSDDPSAEKNNGDLGFFTADRMVKPFADAAFAMNEEGQISEPVLSEYGYHLIQFQERLPSERKAFDEVKHILIAELKKDYLSQLRQDKMAAVYNSIESADYDAILDSKTALQPTAHSDPAMSQ